MTASEPRAAIYCRVSSEKQETNYSLPTQEAACREYAAERLECLSYEQRRQLLDIIGLRVRVWGRKQSPRWVIDVDPALVSTTST